MEEENECYEKEMEIANGTTTTSPADVKEEEVLILIQMMSVSMVCIYHEICKQKEDEHQINNKLMWCSRGDERIESKTKAIKDHEYCLGKAKPDLLPMRSISRTSGYLSLSEKDAQTPVVVGIDRKRCQNRLKNERIDLEYLEHVQEELLASKKSDGKTNMGGMQELNDVMESLVHRIQHGNSNRAQETKLFHEIRKLEETKEKYIYTPPAEHSPNDYWKGRVVGAHHRVAKRNKANEHQINILLNDIKEIKRDKMAHTARAVLLKGELEHVRKNIRCMEREVEKISSKRMKAYKCAYELQEQIGLKYGFGMYESVMTHAKQLVREGNIVRLRRVCDNELEHCMRQWSSGKVFPCHYGWALKKVNSNRIKELGEQMKKKSSYSNYQLFKTHVKKLVREGDVVALRQLCDKQANEFLRRWSNNELFSDD